MADGKIPDCVNGRCLIQGGTFTMGSPEGVGDPDEHPQKQVTVTTFRVGQTEVSVGDYNTYLFKKAGSPFWVRLCGCAKGDPAKTIFKKAGEPLEKFHKRVAQVYVTEQCKTLITGQVKPKGRPMKRFCGVMNGRGDDYPVVCLTMKEKKDYCAAQGGRLMTAAEFHYAARFDEQDAGVGQMIVWDNGDKWYNGRKDLSSALTQPVASGYKNRYGVYNLLGNVWESLADAYERDFYARMPGTDPYNPLTDPYDGRTNREGQLEEFAGGSFFNFAKHARAADRFSPDPVGGGIVDGFRCVWSHDFR